MLNEQSETTQAFHGDTRQGGHLYMQTNETRNAVIHYLWSASGTITEAERIPTGGSGSGAFSPIYQINRPNDFEGEGSVILTPDQRFLLTTNAGDPDNAHRHVHVTDAQPRQLRDPRPAIKQHAGRRPRRAAGQTPSSHLRMPSPAPPARHR
jgi:hypothetical protein